MPHSKDLVPKLLDQHAQVPQSFRETSDQKLHGTKSGWNLILWSVYVMPNPKPKFPLAPNLGFPRAPEWHQIKSCIT